MELYIQIKDGQPVDHPIFGENFRQAFPDIDVENLPPTFAKFERIAEPAGGVFEVVEGPSYEWVDGVVTDIWNIRQMTAEEELQKRQDLADNIYLAIEFSKTRAQMNADTAPSDEAKQAWLEYLAALNVWTLVDPVNPNIPRPPMIKPDGTVLSTNQSGTEPNVIG